MVPAAVYVALAAEIGTRLNGVAKTVIRGLVWTRPLRLAGGSPKQLSVEVMPQKDSWRIVFSSEEGARQVEYSSASLARISSGVGLPKANIEYVKGRCTQHYSGDSCYVKLKEWGIEY